MTPVSADSIDYAILSSGEFDMAILGWRVGAYPGYLCDWFEAGGLFPYPMSALTGLCGELAVTSDLEKARGQIGEMQHILARDVPMVPLFAAVTFDSFRNVSYPFDCVPDGLAGVYGAPGLAFPAAR